jgi:hypothetical protein
MAPTRAGAPYDPSEDTGIGSVPSPRSDIWAYGGPPYALAMDTGTASEPAPRSNDPGTAFVPPVWL